MALIWISMGQETPLTTMTLKKASGFQIGEMSDWLGMNLMFRPAAVLPGTDGV